MGRQKSDNKLEILKQLYSDLSEECKQEFLRAIVENSTYPIPNNDVENVSPEEFLIKKFLSCYCII
ncbi:MAG: hypothetical protein E7222_14980 [Clostridiales bacterium]|nr:hypothetical protein [Clostridiales bacterium]